MRLIVLFIILACCLNVTAQAPKFDKIIFSYVKGHNSWGDPGVYGTEERLELIPSGTKTYRIETYLKIESTAGDDGATFSKDTIEVPLNEAGIVNNRIDSLCRQLTVTKGNFTAAFIKPYLRSPNRNEILEMSRKLDEHYKFEDRDRDDLKDRFSRIKRFDKIDSFINLKRPDPKLFTVTIDAWNALRIYLIRQNDTTIFKADFLEPLGQPINQIRENHQFTMVQYLNLEVNRLLEEILPIGTEIRKRVSIDGLTDDYIKWYIDKVL